MIDITPFEQYQNDLLRTIERLDNIFIEAIYEIAARELRLAKKDTPVGKYPPGSGKVGGTLRRGWHISEIQRTEGGYQIEVFNNVEYAPYLEFGHRTRDGRKWKQGYFMLTIAENKVRSVMDKIIERKIQEVFRNL